MACPGQIQIHRPEASTRRLEPLSLETAYDLVENQIRYAILCGRLSAVKSVHRISRCRGWVVDVDRGRYDFHWLTALQWSDLKWDRTSILICNGQRRLTCHASAGYDNPDGFCEGFRIAEKVSEGERRCRVDKLYERRGRSFRSREQSCEEKSHLVRVFDEIEECRKIQSYFMVESPSGVHPACQKAAIHSEPGILSQTFWPEIRVAILNVLCPSEYGRDIGGHGCLQVSACALLQGKNHFLPNQLINNSIKIQMSAPSLQAATFLPKASAQTVDRHQQARCSAGCFWIGKHGIS